MDEFTGWAADLVIEVGGHGVVSHTGAVALRALADRTGLTAGLSAATRRRGFEPVHDRGRVLADLAVAIADGARVLSDFAVLRDQGEVFGPVASDPTLWRTLNSVDGLQRDRIAAARARARRHVWDQIVARHGRIPAARVADADLGSTVVVRRSTTPGPSPGPNWALVQTTDHASDPDCDPDCDLDATGTGQHWLLIRRNPRGSSGVRTNVRPFSRGRPTPAARTASAAEPPGRWPCGNRSR